MDQTAFKTIPLEVAMEHYKDASKRGRDAGTILERQRIVNFLKEHGYYEAAFALTHAKQNA